MRTQSPRKTSGQRLGVTYLIRETPERIDRRVEEICVEQTIEFPSDLVTDPEILRDVVGRVESVEDEPDGRFKARVSYPVEAVAGELPQFINVLFGNISLQPGVKIVDVELPPSFLRWFKGPRFGIAGLRKHLQVSVRPLLCTAIKPMGLSSKELAEYAYLFAAGGVDMVKDDHGLSNQPFSRFKERAERCVDAVQRGNREGNNRCVFVPNVSGPAHEVLERARFAAKAGAGGLLVSPGLVGFDTMRMLADDDSIGLPILSHPAFLGSMLTSAEGGIDHGVLLGTLNRLAGADAVVFPSYGGRFSFTQSQCQSTRDGLLKSLGKIAPAWPAPGGGMTLDRIPELVKFYGLDTMLLIGGDLHRPGHDLAANSRAFRRAVLATR